MTEALLPSDGKTPEPRQQVTPSVAPLAPPPPDLFVAGKEFHLKEYESLKKELGELVEHSRKLEIYAVGGIAAFYAWYFTVKTSSVPPGALYIPVLLAFLAGLRSWSVLIRITEIAKYIVRVEAAFSLPNFDVIGWETYRSKPENDSSPFLASASVFWSTLLAGSLLAKYLLA